jgi:hypothetical protein
VAPNAGTPVNAGKGRLLDWLDAVAKLVGAFAVVAVAIFANSLQTRVTGISIQSQREQAESQLRASMFTSLIGPIVGAQKDGSIPADRERLMAELLALNFHENFELKPLLEDAAKRLEAETKSKPQVGMGDLQSKPTTCGRVACISSCAIPDLGAVQHAGMRSLFPDLRSKSQAPGHHQSRFHL